MKTMEARKRMPSLFLASLSLSRFRLPVPIRFPHGRASLAINSRFALKLGPRGRAEGTTELPWPPVDADADADGTIDASRFEDGVLRVSALAPSGLALLLPILIGMVVATVAAAREGESEAIAFEREREREEEKQQSKRD